ncbi:3-hydroxyacyl-CoA dehydrogenase NAD-binding domain-containing protein [Tunturiibacter gelidoferens]|uniref:3-hydroxybutyryl-CoA dehydrogenase n=1 Tax=Tunturiibacter gelidiferens TaxID=3069689 RepID=A0A9X0QHD6_9BACT|nr:3-hydroxyacyl-CoA dehydrogenase NAD-binding domain-containing protein [Edaphobacter lichenicola]MBB5330526.1 3-hydroxybutyryl-CoA dehydrogenase [Edaphobacter lichenicola]
MKEEAVGQPSPEIRRVAIIGAGVAGRSFALACVAAGFDVVLEDVMPANLWRAEAEYSDLSARVAAGSLELAQTVEDAVRTADIAVDFVPDELESKLEIFSMIDRMAPPKTILCTPSYALSITDLASCVYRPERCFAVRGNLVRGDAVVAPIVRLLYPGATLASVVETVRVFLRTLGVAVQVEADPDEPVLRKNASSSVTR